MLHSKSYVYKQIVCVYAILNQIVGRLIQLEGLLVQILVEEALRISTM